MFEYNTKIDVLYRDGLLLSEAVQLAGHNAFASVEDGWITHPMQQFDYIHQFYFGARCFMVDLYEENNQLVLLHNEGFKVFAGIGSSVTKTFFFEDFLRGVKNLLDLNSKAIITLIIENHVPPQAIKKDIIAANATSYLLSENPNSSHMTFGHMRKSNQRLVVFTENGPKTEEGIYSTNYYKETTYSLGDDKLCTERGERRAPFADPNVKIFVLNHFYKQSCASSATRPMSGNSVLPFFKPHCPEVNNYEAIKNRVDLCQKTGNKVTFIAVDFMDEGDALKVVADLNDPTFYNKHFLKKSVTKHTANSAIDTGTMITVAGTAIISGVISIAIFWNCFKCLVLPYYEIRFLKGGGKAHPCIFKLPVGGKEKRF